MHTKPNKFNLGFAAIEWKRTALNLSEFISKLYGSPHGKRHWKIGV